MRPNLSTIIRVNLISYPAYEDEWNHLIQKIKNWREWDNFYFKRLKYQCTLEFSVYFGRAIRGGIQAKAQSFLVWIILC